MNANGTSQTRLTDSPEPDFDPVFSPDGSKIAFAGYPGGNFEVTVMRAEGSGPINLTGNAARDEAPDWAPIISSGPGVPPPGADTPTLCPQGTSPSVRCVRDNLGRLAMIGAELSETFVGTSGRDRISPFGGNDLVNALAGHDLISGGTGRDTLNGGKGNDRINGNAGNDKLSGGRGKDSISGLAGNDRLDGGSGNDRLSGGSGRDSLNGGSGKDSLKCGMGRDRAVRTGGDRVSRTCERR